jgi:hypothetical protein
MHPPLWYYLHTDTDVTHREEHLRKAAKKQDAKLDKLKESWVTAQSKPEKGKGKKGKAARRLVILLTTTATYSTYMQYLLW